MLILQEFEQLREDLIRDKKTIKEIEDILLSNSDKKSRSWYTKDWKERRDKIIKDHCEICNSKENLTLQHQSHPQNYYAHKNNSISNYNDQIQDLDINNEEFGNYVKDTFNYDPTPICPKCRMWSPRERKRDTPKYVCTNSNCKHEFNTPVYKNVDEIIDQHLNEEYSTFLDKKCFTTNDGWTNSYNIRGIEYKFKKQKTLTARSDEINKETLLKYIEDNIKYLSFVDTITACRRCAYHYDMKRMDLCPKCKSYYKSFQYETCIQCLPEERRIQIAEQIEFNKQMNLIHKELDIE